MNPGVVISVFLFQNLAKGLDFPLGLRENVGFWNVDARFAARRLLVFFVIIGKLCLAVPFLEVRNKVEPLPGLEVGSPIGIVVIGINHVGIVRIVNHSPSAAPQSSGNGLRNLLAVVIKGFVVLWRD